MKNYLINEDTIIIFKKGKKTVIVEENQYLELSIDIMDIINESCNYYCSSLKGRIEGSNYLLGNNYKTPVIISETREIILFPTSSYRSDDCIWINYKKIDRYYSKRLNTIIEFINGKKITIRLSNKVINKQILKSSRLESILKSKKQ